jgi:hypothetical protein
VGAAKGYFKTWPISSRIDLIAWDAAGLDKMKTAVTNNGFFVFQAEGCSWNFRKLDQFIANNVWDQFEGTKPGLPSANLSRRWEIDIEKKDFFVRDAGNGEGVLYLIRDNVLKNGANYDAEIKGEAFVLPFCFDSINDHDLNILKEYVLFTRPKARIDNIETLYKDMMTSVSYGLRYQQEVNDIQNEQIKNNISGVATLGETWSVENGIAQAGIATLPGMKMNPLYKGSHEEIDHFINTLPAALNDNGEFGFLLNGQGAPQSVVKVQTQGGDVTKPLTEVVTGNEFAETGDRIYKLVVNPEADATFGAMIPPKKAAAYLVDWFSEQSQFSIIGELRFMPAKGETGGYFYFARNDGDGVVYLAFNPVSTLADDFSTVYNGTLVTWVKDTRTITFDRPVRILPFDAADAPQAAIKALTTITTSQGVSSRQWAVLVDAVPEAAPHTSEVVDPGTGKTGLMNKFDLVNLYDGVNLANATAEKLHAAGIDGF